MPLIRISNELYQDILAENPLVKEEVENLFTSMTYLGYDRERNANVILVSAPGFEPGEYFVEIVFTVRLGENGEKRFTYELKRV